MTPNKSWFNSYQTAKDGKVFLGDNSVCHILGTSSIPLKMHNGVFRVLQNVKHVPGLKRNLISLGTFEKDGYKFLVENGEIIVSKGDKMVLKSFRRNGLYYLMGSIVTNVACPIIAEIDKTNLWHKRLGHISNKSLVELSKQELLGNDKIVDQEFCEQCVLGKQHRLAFKNSTHRVSHILQYLHSDLWGPAKVPSWAIQVLSFYCG